MKQNGDQPDQANLIDAAFDQIDQMDTTQAHLPSSLRTGSASHFAGISTDTRTAVPGYRIIDEIHRGGQGVVFRAAQKSTGRLVALKVMHGGPFAGPKERARFEREVQILAQLKHPNIVTIHDSGSCGDNAYFVMDHIDGHPLDAYIRNTSPPLEERLRLFATICEAVNVAHLRGVIHRDLKPGNIRIDVEGTPHVLDFGLAKHSDWQSHHEDDEGSAHQTVTVTGQFVGSMPWASPEQARGRLDEIDLRTDVYSLGVMLYQLLTGAFPYEISGSLTEVAANIINTQPKNPRALNAQLDDEVATITLKALRKERELRYQSAGNMGQDIERYLNGEPIEAKRDSVTYIIRKQFAKHRVAVSVAASFVVMLVIGLVISVSFWQQAVVARNAEADQTLIAKQHEQQAIHERDLAAAEAEKAKLVLSFLTDMLSSANPQTGERADLLVREAIDTAVRRLDQGAFANQPELEKSLRRVIGDTFGSLGLYDAAIRQHELALNLEPIEEDEWMVDDLEAATANVAFLRLRGDRVEAEKRSRQNLDIALKKFGPDHEIVALCLRGLAAIERDADNINESERLLRESERIFRQDNPEKNVQLAVALNDLFLTLQKQGKTEEAISVITEAIDIYNRIYSGANHQSATAAANLASAYITTGEYEKAEPLFLQALDDFKKINGDKNPSVASCLGSIGRLYTQWRKLDIAEQYLTESLQMRREVLGEDHPLMAFSLNNVARVQSMTGQYDKSIANFTAALKLFEQTRGADHPSVEIIKSNIAGVYVQRGDFEKAIPIIRESVAVRRERLGEEHPRVAEAENNLAKALKDKGDFDEAESLARTSLEKRRALWGDDHPFVAGTMSLLGDIMRAKGNKTEAETLLRSSWQINKRLFGDDHPSTAETENTLALLLGELGNWTDAEKHLQHATAVLEKHLPADHPNLALARMNWGGALLNLNRPVEAAAQIESAAKQINDRFDDTHVLAVRVKELQARLQNMQTEESKPSPTKPQIK